MLVEFDKLKRVRLGSRYLKSYRLTARQKDFQEHQNEIHSKLVAIMGDRISAHVKSLQVSHMPLVCDYELSIANHLLAGRQLGNTKAK